MTDVLPRESNASAGQPTLTVRLLGAFQLCLDHGTVPVPSGCQRLLAMLALRGGTGRSRLAGSLWPDTAQRRALANLRTTIWRTNQALPGLVVSGYEQVTLRPGVRVDVNDLVARARRLLDIGALPPPDLHLPLDEGDLLPDWEDEWLAVDRERLHQLRLHVFEATAQRLAEAGQYGLALESALAALRADPLRESAYRSVIAIHLAEGNIAEARRVYAECATALARELGVAPSFRIQGLDAMAAPWRPGVHRAAVHRV